MLSFYFSFIYFISAYYYLKNIARIKSFVCSQDL